MPSLKVLQLVSVGDIPGPLLRELEGPITTHLGVPVTIAKLALTTPAYAFNKDRQQYHCNAILRRLAPLAEPGGGVLGITDVDLFVPDAPHVFGEADRESRTALMSLFRLRTGADMEMLRRRAQLEALHQAGHLVGLSYCEDSRCAMFLAQTTQELDRKGPSLCNLCRNELVKLQR
ncbi:MAG: non-proteolytic archaemetzincin-like protein [Myxococcaceae bacterium]|nr:non-proteolytic archaemetzincin-like protein [Myxococcaceae bacterium]MCI0670919.1 non-proteolytic archaemetzincin-like protein [Myxococcaceae bacterium]